MSELKACPWDCGLDRWLSQENGYWIVNCGCGIKYGLFKTEENAVAAWNSRPVREEVGEHEFKNFHRLLCERFGYGHDEIDWRRDQASLIEHIAKLVHPDTAERLREAILEKRKQVAERRVGMVYKPRKWRRGYLWGLDFCLSLLPPSKTESKGETT